MVVALEGVRIDVDDSFNEKMADRAAERAVLVGLFQYGEDAYLDVADFLDAGSFTDVLNQVAFKCVKHMYEAKGIKRFDQSSLMATASELGYETFFESPADLQHLRSLMNGRVILENVRTWGAQVRKLQVGRLLRDQLRESAMTLEDIKGTESIESILGIAETVVFDFSSLLHNDETSTPQLIGVGLHEYLDELEANPVEIVGVSTGMPFYDQSIGGGLRRKAVSLIGARPKTGKSMLAANIALHISKNIDMPVLMLDTEMVTEDHWTRMLPNLCVDLGVKVTITEIETGQYSRNEVIRGKVREAADILAGDDDNPPVQFHYLNVSGKPFEEIISIMRRWVTKEVGFDEEGNRNDCVVIYDYLKMMSGEGLNDSMKEYQVLGFMMTALHNFAVRHDVPLLSFIQLNRDGIDRETTDIISGSDRVLWLVTNFSIYKEKSPEEIADSGPQHGNRKLVPVSARHGEGLQHGDYINVKFDGKYGRIREGDTKLMVQAMDKQDAMVDDAEDIPFGDGDETQSSDS
jgi:replicative DNA helicase